MHPIKAEASILRARESFFCFAFSIRRDFLTKIVSYIFSKSAFGLWERGIDHNRMEWLRAVWLRSRSMEWFPNENIS